MQGTDANTGKAISGTTHLRQSIRDILTTPIGSRIMRRDYGSRLFELVDSPTNAETVAEVYSATVEALIKWEPRILVMQIKVASVSIGGMMLDLTLQYIPEGKVITLDGISIQ